MNRNILAQLIGRIYREQADDTGDKGGAVTVSAADARTYLAEFGHNAETLKGMQDADVVKMHGTVSAAYGKRFESDSKAATEKLTKTRDAEAATHATKWEKGEYKLALPEKSALSQEDLDRIGKEARERRLSQKDAEALVASEDAIAKRAIARQVTEHNAKVTGWIKAIESDKEMGGANLVETQRLAGLAIARFVKDDPELTQLLGKDNGDWGQHPAVVRLWRKIGMAMSEDKGLSGKGPGAAPKDAASVLYGGDQKS